MKRFTILSIVLCALSAGAQTTTKVVEARSESHAVEYAVASSPKLVFGTTELVFTDRTQSTTFAATERVVLRIKEVENVITAVQPMISTEIGEAANSRTPLHVVEGAYNLAGQRATENQRGIKIIATPEGTRKVMKK